MFQGWAPSWERWRAHHGLVRRPRAGRGRGEGGKQTDVCSDRTGRRSPQRLASPESLVLGMRDREPRKDAIAGRQALWVTALLCIPLQGAPGKPGEPGPKGERVSRRVSHECALFRWQRALCPRWLADSQAWGAACSVASLLSVPWKIASPTKGGSFPLTLLYSVLFSLRFFFPLLVVILRSKIIAIINSKASVF